MSGLLVDDVLEFGKLCLALTWVCQTYGSCAISASDPVSARFL